MHRGFLKIKNGRIARSDLVERVERVETINDSGMTAKREERLKEVGVLFTLHKRNAFNRRYGSIVVYFGSGYGNCRCGKRIPDGIIEFVGLGYEKGSRIATGLTNWIQGG